MEGAKREREWRKGEAKCAGSNLFFASPGKILTLLLCAFSWYAMICAHLRPRSTLCSSRIHLGSPVPGTLMRQHHKSLCGSMPFKT